MAVAVRQTDGTLTDPMEIERVWKERIGQAREARKPHEPTWHSNLAYAAGKHWQVYDKKTRTMRHIGEVDPEYADRDLYTADVITEHRAAALGELESDDDRPELLLPGNGEESEHEEEFQAHLNRAVGHGWDYEWQGDLGLLDARRKCLDMGVAAIRCRFDPTAGKPLMDEVPFQNGQPLWGDDAHAALANGPSPDVSMRQINEGAIRWQTGSPFNLLTPPGVVHERDFPWEVWVAPEWLEGVQEHYGDVAADLKEDSDISSTSGSTAENSGAYQSQDGGSPGRLRGHVWVYTCYQRPSAKFPKGRVVVLASNQMRLLDVRDELPYVAPDGTYRSGIAYFHYWRRNDTFWSRAFIEALKDPQRMINRRKTQGIEIIDRSMPFILVAEGALPQKPSGRPMEYVEVKDQPDKAAPQIFGGQGAGPWMYQDVEAMREDLAHASTLSTLRLGENPQNVDTYSQLALLSEQENAKRQPILFEHKLAIKQLVEDSVYDVSRYWGPQKQILVAGEGNRVQAQEFDATKVPPFYIVNVAKGSAKPRSQAAELKKVDDLWRSALDSGVVPHNPEAWMAWRKASMDAGQPLELPEMPSDDQTDKAQLENHHLLQGADAPVAYYDRPDIHIPIHRSAQDQALLSGDMQTFQRIEQHVQAHLEAAAANAAQTGPQPAPVPQAAAAAP